MVTSAEMLQWFGLPINGAVPFQSFHLVQPTLGYQAEGELSSVNML
ncbi:hypothetical protein HanRHA438_Chr08g0356821 [Helianthus annuus]|nr:hypothetical protein HanRHA438_Chr08g0356821 [Helianthus annuus]